ncbi:nuclear export factor GLE1 [Gordoniibacillus kamchatkensis]|uniref:Nuclear export factor GLE1 n=1 Tax=Gordoniibacillus kamchatkensis TaxID=1590651 RepID=A0ABR5ADP8_9BACL|nr:YcnI family protein [Paenibacillus sp. VKM B-2647]KIL39166.1 nuclear export factor GLE1 [Paenibacillus sp. VKM B-2647]
MRKTGWLTALCLCGLLLWAGVASAHVVVYPQQTTQGSYEKFTVRVPSESQNSSTVKVEVRFNPAEVTISRFEPKPGWTYQTTKDATGAITSVVWTAQGDGLSPTEFAEFNMQGKVSDKATAITWKAYQTYKDGSVAEWVGAAGSDKPASVTKVAAKPAGADAHGGHDTGQNAAAAAAGTAGSTLPLALSIVGVILGALALIVALLRRRRA